MAFVRWRKNSAQLVATLYEQGRSRQIVLAPLGTGFRIPPGLQDQVKERFPHISVDWPAIARAMTKGPPGSPPVSVQEWGFSEVEYALRAWAKLKTPFAREADVLCQAADVLASWRARAYWQAQDNHTSGKE
ncbi:hypothetical protein D2Q93_09345 [Alicyclobacillaceae bacterium I2511]|nr:hypothetical protein D2Q93_09345 [Alicyclobacillaceae bacterium I2511]